ncbi:MAG TPA: GNAT family N-acetyltransferase [Gaiellaceae bacterium]
MTVFEPTTHDILGFCGGSPVERVFLEDVARRGLGRFLAAGEDGELSALCHVGANIVPSGSGCGAFAGHVARADARMLIGEAGAVAELWNAARSQLPRAREDRPGQPVFAMRAPPAAGESGLRPATLDDVSRLVPACAAAHELELGIDPLARNPDEFRWRTAAQVEEGRSWVWLEDDVVRFKAEASAWTPFAIQLQQVWVDPQARGRGFGARGLADLIRLLLATTPVVTLFVRADNAPAIALYEAVGMERELEYRSVLF